jgi:hypothetical protein
MNTLHVLYHLALADFFERARRYSFLLVLAAVIYMGVLVNNGTMFLGLIPGDLTPVNYRGVFNSAWIGTMTVLVTNSFLALFGFYLVSDCIARDARTGVGQIIATTPVSRGAYLLGKWLSNFAVLAVLEVILAAAALIMVLLKREGVLDLGALMTPFFAAGFPFMAFIAALAVVVETIPWLRGALGNLLYFFMWLAMVFGSFFLNSGLPILGDPMGFKVFRGSLAAAVSAAYPGETIFGYSSVIDIYHNQEFRVFDWSGLDWNLSIVASHWLWVVLALGFVLLSAVWFTRFDPSREGLRLAREKSEEGKGVEPRIKVPHITLPSLSPFVSKLAQANPFLGVLFAELRMLLNGRRWWWWAILIGLNFAILGNPPSLLEPFLLPMVWLCPLAIWSEMGNRERKNNTYQMVFSSARPVLRQLPAAWLAGVLATALLVIGGAVFSISNSDLPGLVGWAGAVVFVPTLALALGVVSSGSRVFEVVYVIWWYIGPLQKTPGVDFTYGSPQIYLLASAGLLLLSMFWRGRQVRV